MPAQCIDRQKKGFTVPLDIWFRGSLKGYIASSLLDGTLEKFGFESTALQELLDIHNSNKKDQSDKLWSLLCLKIWLTEWF